MTLRARALWAAVTVSALVLLGGCPGPDWPKCENDDQCKSDRKGNELGKDLICVFGQCQECAKDAQCKAGLVCRSYRCVARPACERDGDCADGKVCKAGQCRTECQGDTECGFGKNCVKNRCVGGPKACAEDGDCPEGEGCKKGFCDKGAGTGSSGSDDPNAGKGDCQLEPRIFFAFNEASIAGEAKAALDKNAQCLKQKGELKITIEGHCDERGTTEYNLALGERRAKATLDYLKSLGIDSARVKVVSFGEEQPLETSGTEDAWTKNRRAEFKTR